MAEDSGFHLDEDFGPPKLRKIHQTLVSWINAITPKEGLGIKLVRGTASGQASVSKEGLGAASGIQIHADPGVSGEASIKKPSPSGGGSSGTPVDVYGAFNGAPAVFHLFQSSAPTQPPP